MITSDKTDIVLVLPVEYIETLLEVFNVGLQRAKINPKTRKELFAWWNVEKELIEKELTKK